MRLILVLSLLINVAVLLLVGSAGGQSPAMWRSRWSATAGVFRAEAGKLKDPPEIVLHLSRGWLGRCRFCRSADGGRSPRTGSRCAKRGPAVVDDRFDSFGGWHPVDLDFHVGLP